MFAFYFLLCYKINFDGGDLSSDAGLLLIKEFISKLGIDTLLEKAFQAVDKAPSCEGAFLVS